MGSTQHTTRRLKQSNFSSRHRNSVVFVIVGLLLVGALGFGGYEAGRNFGWWGETNGVRLLKEDPLTQPDLLDYRLAHTEQQQAPGFLQKPTSPFVIHWFYADGRSLEDMKQEVVRYAEKNGWQYDAPSSTQEYWNGRKTGASGHTLWLSIQIVSQDDEADTYKTPPAAIKESTLRVITS